MPAAVCAHSLRCSAIRSLGNSRRPACSAWICDDWAGENSHNALTYRQLRVFTPARSYEKTYNLAGPKSKSYHRIRLIFYRLHSNIITLAPARSSKNLTSLYRAAGGGTRDANYAVPERTSTTSCRRHAKRAAAAKEFASQEEGRNHATAKKQKRWTTLRPSTLCIMYCAKNYIIPPSGIAGAAGAGSGMSTIPHSVVKNIPATDAAFSRATRLTLVGSMTPASNMFTYSPVRAL